MTVTRKVGGKYYSKKHGCRRTRKFRRHSKSKRHGKSKRRMRHTRRKRIRKSRRGRSKSHRSKRGGEMDSLGRQDYIRTLENNAKKLVTNFAEASGASGARKSAT